ncbi:sensor histidine kinase [Hydrogenimonas urashimensis]|uniref:sensor histidine kinase n=1 Tax=Hydrogenimonas urashimensis TaxID=2740515 RepID=UPI0019163F4A|nr:HAMP domain-containing sensor histidine kinase [Hydrogenimonas urashimensis]
MKRHEKRAFWKFFLLYFTSVAALVLVAGFFYFQESKAHMLKSEEFSLIEFARHIKMGGPAGEFSDAYAYRFIPANNRHIDIRNFTVRNGRFVKIIPMPLGDVYLEVSKSTRAYQEALHDLRLRIWAVQFLILLIFGLISYRLAKNAIKPLEESIELLDRFAKDLIHDLNTPVTAIKLNLSLLKKIPALHESRVLHRLQKSVHTISELHENLTILLEEKTFQMQRTDLCSIVQEVVQIQKPLYPNLDFFVECHHFFATVHAKAFKQLLQNIVSNACRYNRPGGFVKIYTRGRTLIVEDNGIGIENPQKIFERNYSESGSSGIGLDIVKRLSYAMNIKIKIESSKNEGTRFLLTMR